MKTSTYFSKALNALSGDQKREIKRLIVISIFTGFIEILTISSFLPFLTLSMDDGRDLFIANRDNYFVPDNLSFDTFLLLFGLLCVALIVVANITKMILLYKTAKLMAVIEASFSTKALASILDKPFYWLESKDIKELFKYPLSEASHLVAVCYFPFVNLISSLIITTMLVFLAVAVQPLIVIGVIVFLFIILLSYYLLTIDRISKNASLRGSSNTKKHVLAIDIISNYLEIKLYNAREYFLKRYLKRASEFSKAQAFAQVVGNLPRYLIEGTLLSAAIFSILIISFGGGNLIDYVAKIGFFCVFLLRTLPYVQISYNSFNQIEYGKPLLEEFFNMIFKKNDNVSTSMVNGEGITNQISIGNYLYRKEAIRQDILNVEKLRIMAGEKIAIIGESGSGKSTLIKALCGFFEEVQEIAFLDKVNNKLSNESHLQSVAYVPQNIINTSISIRENITFGDISISEESMYEGLEQTDMKKTILKLPSKLNEPLFGSNAKLSGGQLQRLNIVRAICRGKRWMFLDEVCSAIDPLLEKKILKNLLKLHSESSIIMSTHRFENLYMFDRVLALKDGKIIFDGKHSILLKHHDYRSYVL